MQRRHSKEDILKAADKMKASKPPKLPPSEPHIVTPENPYERLHTLLSRVTVAVNHFHTDPSRYYNALADVHDFLDQTPMADIMDALAGEMDKGKEFLKDRYPALAFPMKGLVKK